MSALPIGTGSVLPQSFLEMPAVVAQVFGSRAQEVSELVARLGVPTDAVSLRDAERAIFACTAKASDQIVGSLIELAKRDNGTWDSARAGAEDVAAARTVRLRNKGMREVGIMLLGGTVMTLAMAYFAPDHSGKRGRRRKARGKTGTGCYPLLEQLGVIEGMSPSVALEVSRQATALASFKEAKQSLETRNLDLDSKTVRRITELCGDRALRCRDERIAAFDSGQGSNSGEFTGRRVAAFFDGGRTRTRVSTKQGPRRKKSRRRGFKTEWREPKVMALYAFDDKGVKTSQRPVYEGTFETWDDAFRMFVAECSRRGVAEASELVIGGDGSLNIWDHIDPFIAKLGIPLERVFKVVDYYHAAEHVNDIAKLCKNWSAKKRRTWARAVTRDLRAGRIDSVIEAIKPLAVGRRAEDVNKILSYFEKRKDLMRYAQLRKRHLPIGSGAVESAVRRVVNLRLKGAGIFWDVENAERLLMLRGYLKAGRWDEVENDILSPVATWHRRLQPRERTRATA